MRLSVSFIACVFLLLNGVFSIHLDKQCGVLETVVLKQAHLEKKVEAHDKLLSGESCAGGTIV